MADTFVSLTVFQSTPSAWRETKKAILYRIHFDISIHSLRMEGDKRRMRQFGCHFLFQSTPSAWRETLPDGEYTARLEFQSTPSAWRETIPQDRETTCGGHFNPLPPHGGRQNCFRSLCPIILFQSTPSAWRETIPQDRETTCGGHFNPLPPHGGRQNCFRSLCPIILFQSTPSAWRETTKPL